MNDVTEPLVDDALLTILHVNRSKAFHVTVLTVFECVVPPAPPAAGARCLQSASPGNTPTHAKSNSYSQHPPPSRVGDCYITRGMSISITHLIINADVELALLTIFSVK